MSSPPQSPRSDPFSPQNELKFAYPSLTDLDFHDASPPHTTMLSASPVYPSFKTKLSFHGGTEVLGRSNIPLDVISDRSRDKRLSVDKADGRVWDGLVSPFPLVSTNVWRKLDWRLLPVASMFVFLSFLDRANIGNARIAGFQDELGITNYQYSIALTATYCTYIAVELPSALLQKYIGPNIMLPTMVVLWGLACTLQGLVHTFTGLIVCRLFIGLFEGGMLPGLALYLSTFYPRQRLQSRISAFFAASSLAGAFSGLLASAIVKMDGVAGRSAAAWIFILEGIFTILFGFASYFMLPRNIADARFLSPDEKTLVVTTLKADIVLSEEDKFSWREVGVAMVQPQVLFMLVAGFCNGSTLLGLAYFAAPVVQGLGFQGNLAQIMSVPPFALSFVLSIFSSWISDRYKCRGLTAMFFAVCSIVGFSIFLADASDRIKYMSLFFLIPGTYCAAPPLAAWVSNNSAPYYRRATALAMFTTLTNSGGILSVWLFGTLSPAPKYTTATITFLCFSGAILISAASNLVYLVFQNRRKATTRGFARREAEPRGLGDKSAFFKYNL